MADAILGGVVARETISLNRIRVIEPNAARRGYLRKRYGDEIVLFERMLDDAVAGMDLLVLCVKPQIAAEALEGCRPDAETVVVSIMAGIDIASIREMLGGHKAVVRSMPNTPAQVYRAVTVYSWEEGSLNEQQARFTEYLLNSLGLAIQMRDESYVEKATGVTGSGPGFVFLIMESFCDAAVELGFTQSEARQMVVGLFDGVSALALERPEFHLATLRNQVTSPGGTTAAGLAVMERSGVRTAIRK